MRIGFFDSGIGGLTVLYDSLRLLEDQDYIYYADIENVPYGTKDKELVKEYIFTAIDFIIRQGVDALVLACNTATSIAVRELRARYQIPIIGMEPAVKPAVKNSREKRVLVLATPLTLKEDKYEDLVSRVDQNHIVDSLPLPGLVEFAENYRFEEPAVEEYLRRKLAPFDLEKYGTIVLGCTHFLYFKKMFRQIFPPGVEIIDGHEGTIRHLAKIMQIPLRQEGVNPIDLLDRHVSLYLSGIEGDREILRKYFAVLQ
ncbi:MAG: glutamate racemase [Halanaerobiaceae bacterium]|nr:glutamate racemase [Halanaerobiaceae bacterium]